MATNRIYLDYASATPLDPRVRRAMQPFDSSVYGNAGSRHQEGIEAKKYLSESRQKVAGVLGVKEEEIVFTSGGTESNNLALSGFLRSIEEKNELDSSHVITTNIEHPSVLEVFEHYKKRGLKVSFTPVGENGIIDLEKMKELVSKETVLVSVGYVNGEIGVIQPLRKIKTSVLKDNPKIVFHTDASQAPCYLKISPESLGVDMMSLDAQKIYGPKGVGALYKNNKVKLLPIMYGGSQERGLRPGTENIPLIVAFAEALKIAQEEKDDFLEKVAALRDYFLSSVLQIFPTSVLNGDRTKRIANNVNITFPGLSSEVLVIKLDQNGIAASTKSACTEEDKEESYVLGALRTKDTNGLRFTLGKETTKEEINKTIEILKKILTRA